MSLNAWLLLFPSSLCVDWTMQSVPLVESISDPRNVATLVTYILLTLLGAQALIRKNDKHVTVVIMVRLVLHKLE